MCVCVCTCVQEENKEAMERLTGLADQLVSIGDYCILVWYNSSLLNFEDMELR